MKGFVSLYRKELYSLFASPIFYAVAFTFLVLAGYFFYSAIIFYNLLGFQAAQNPMMAKQMNLMEMVLRPFFFDLSIVLLLLSPLLTMRLLAEERKSGTIELLFTYPLPDRAIILAKFAAVMSVFGVILAGTIPGMFFLNYVSTPVWKPILCGYLGIFLLGSSFMAFGLFTSSLTQNQIVSAVLAFGGILLLWVIGWAKSYVGSPLGETIDYLSIIKHFDTFSKGVFDSRDFLYYLMFTVFFLFLTHRQMATYRWRG